MKYKPNFGTPNLPNDAIVNLPLTVLPPAQPLTPSSDQAEQVTTSDPEPGADQSKVLSLIQRNLGISQPLQSDQELVIAIENQLPVKAISALIKNGLQDKEVYSLIIPRRTLQHRRAKKERLSVEESDRAARVARILALAEYISDDKDKGMRWLRSPKQRFGGHTGMEMLLTEAGGRRVEEWLHQIDHGMAA